MLAKTATASIFWMVCLERQHPSSALARQSNRVSAEGLSQCQRHSVCSSQWRAICTLVGTNHKTYIVRSSHAVLSSDSMPSPAGLLFWTNYVPSLIGCEVVQGLSEHSYAGLANEISTNFMSRDGETICRPSTFWFWMAESVVE